MGLELLLRSVSHDHVLLRLPFHGQGVHLLEANSRRADL